MTPAPPHVKICPNCQTPAQLTARDCGVCGHVYRTNYNPTVISDTRYSPQSAMYGAPLGGGSLNTYAIDEYTRQYVTLCWYVFWGLFFSASLFSLALLVYGIIQQQALRQRVAEMGLDPDVMVREAGRRFWKMIMPLVVVACVFWGIVGAVILWAMFAGNRPEQTDSTETTGKQIQSAPYAPQYPGLPMNAQGEPYTPPAPTWTPPAPPPTTATPVPSPSAEMARAVEQQAAANRELQRQHDRAEADYAAAQRRRLRPSDVHQGFGGGSTNRAGY